MNPFYNPKITIPFVKNILTDPGRIERLNKDQLQKYKDKAFRKIIKYAYTVPLYKEKYEEAGIKLSDIKGLKDIKKLPFINRNDFAKYFPDGIVPTDFNKEKGFTICTGGTTTKYCCNSGAQPVCTYTDFPSLIRGTGINSRINRVFNLNWKKTKFAHIGNFNPFKFDTVYEENVLIHMKSFFSFDNYLSVQASKHTEELINKLEEFQPDVIISYPAIYQDIAYLKSKGYGKNINPKVMFVGGAMLDAYTRRYVEHMFGCKMYNTYASCESGAEIAYECKERNWHIHSDFFHLEAVDKNMKRVDPGKRGRLVITKLWGTGTPIIRYTGMQDWITLGNGKKCNCGSESPIFGRPVEGRVMSNIILPDGQVFSPSQFLIITKVLEELNTFKVKKYQIIQNEYDQIDILLVIDNDLRSKGVSVKDMILKIKNSYEKLTGPKVKINVKEVEEIKDELESGKPAPIVISNVDIECSLE